MDECVFQGEWGLWSRLALGDHLLWLGLCLPVFSASAQGSLPFSVSGPRPHPLALSPVGNLSQAMENVLSVLLFYPEDEAAKKALNQYQAQLGEPRPGLGPREVTPCSILTL